MRLRDILIKVTALKLIAVAAISLIAWCGGLFRKIPGTMSSMKV